MKKRILSLALALSLAVSLFAPAFAAGSTAEPVTPTAPEWIDEEDYIIFPDDEVYLPENWAEIETLREEARNGKIYDKIAKDTPLPEDFKSCSPGQLYEYGLINLKYAINAEDRFDRVSAAYQADFLCFGQVLRGNLDLPEKDYYTLCLYRDVTKAISFLATPKSWGENLLPTLTYFHMTLDDFFHLPYMNLITDECKLDILTDMNQYLAENNLPFAPIFSNQIQLFLDGRYIFFDVPPEITNGRTMIPIRAVAETIGTDVSWEESSRQVILARAGTEIIMTIDSTEAVVNGESVNMDVAPYISGGRTLLPVRYVAEFFGQKVEWDGEKYWVEISENKAIAGDSNLEAWALPMGAMLAKMNGGKPYLFGIYERSADETKKCREDLSSGWNISNRSDLVQTVVSMTYYGHNVTFREMVEDLKQRSPEERAEISAASGAWPEYMWEYTEYVDEKWGDRGILAWDLFRMSNLVQWGYIAGYVTYEEALILLEPAATILCANFSSWDEAYENYLDGYNWWARRDVLGKDIWKTERGVQYMGMKEKSEIAPIFDDSLFETGVIGLPEE